MTTTLQRASRQTAFACLIALLFCVPCLADVRMPGFFGSHMVLQQQMEIQIWGWAEPGESVEVTLGETSRTTMAGENGTWRVVMPPMEASNDPHTLTIAGNNSIVFEDVLIGEVWLCSGQSNMEWSVRQSADAESEIANATDSLIRHIKMPRRPSQVPMEDIQTPWQVCSPDTVAGFTAVGYYMARNLRSELDVPIGLLNTSWGGTRIEPWTPPVGFQQVDALDEIYLSVMGRTPGTDQYREKMETHLQATNAWLEAAQQSYSNTEVISPSPAFPPELVPFTSHQDPTMLYNGMVHALVGFTIRGAIWYQGESNRHDGMMYYEKKKALVYGWRELWNQGEFPFYFVQIGPYQYADDDPTILPAFWEAQEDCLEIPSTGMVVINDIATLNDIHPPNKQEVGRRLSLLALRNDYGREDLVAESPRLESMSIDGDTIVLRFSNTGGGLTTSDGNAPSHFEVAGANFADAMDFKAATAKIDGDTIIVRSEGLASPVAVRFAWHQLAEPNLRGGTGLPVGAFIRHRRP